jgi:hypothetical protein
MAAATGSLSSSSSELLLLLLLLATISVCLTGGGHISDSAASGVESVIHETRSDPVVDPADVKLVRTGSQGLVRMAGLVLGDCVDDVELDPDASASSVDRLQTGSSSRAAEAVNGWLKLASNIPS